MYLAACISQHLGQDHCSHFTYEESGTQRGARIHPWKDKATPCHHTRILNKFPATQDQARLLQASLPQLILFPLPRCTSRLENFPCGSFKIQLKYYPPSPRNPPLLSPGRSPSSLLLVGQLFPGLSPRPLLHVHPPALQGGKGTINAATIVDFNLPWEEMPGRDSGACTSTAPPPQL